MAAFFKIFMKQFTKGAPARYVFSSIVVFAIIVYLGTFIQTEGKISKQILYTTICFCTAASFFQIAKTVAVQNLIRRVTALPFNNYDFNVGLLCALLLHVLLKRASYFFALMVGLTRSDVLTLFVAFVVAVCASVISYNLLYFFANKKVKHLAAIPFLMVAILMANDGMICLVILLFGVATATLPLIGEDANGLCVDPQMRKRNFSSKRNSIITSYPFMVPIKYTTAHFFANRTNIVNVVVLFAFLQFFALSSSSMGFNMAAPIAMAMLSMNTPLLTTVSANKGMTKRLATLPSCSAFFSSFGAGLFLFNLLYYSAFILLFSYLSDSFSPLFVMICLSFPIQIAFFASILERQFPLVTWSVEDELWRHPRKYVIPCILLIETMITIPLFF